MTFNKNKNYEIMRKQLIPKDMTTLIQKDLDGFGLIIQNNKIYPQLDDTTFRFDIDFYNYFVNQIKISKQAVKRKDYYDLFKKVYLEVYRSELDRESIERYLCALTNIWKSNSKLGIRIGKFDQTKKNIDRFVSPYKNCFSHIKTIKKVQNVNIENLEFKYQTFLS